MGMEDLIALLIPLLAVAGWLFGLFRNEEQGNKEQPRRQENRSPAPGTERPNQESQSSGADATTQKSGPKDYYENKKRQVNQLKNETKKVSNAISGSEINIGDNARNPERRVQKNTEEKNTKSRDVAINMKTGMTREGLAKSVVMAEVLGPPRAVKPYRSIISERKR